MRRSLAILIALAGLAAGLGAPAAAQTTTPAATSSTRVDRDDISTAATSPWPWVVAGAAGVALLVLGLALARRRRARRGDEQMADDSVIDLLDAGRQLSAAPDPASAALLAIERATTLVGARAGAYVAVDDGEPRLTHQTSAHLFAADRVGEGVVARALDTGQPERTPQVVDAAFGPRPVSAMVVPVVAEGRVLGALAVQRGVNLAFQARELDLLCRFAPMVAAALRSASRREELASQSLTDGLTSLGNRRRLDQDLLDAFEALEPGIAFVMVDVDHFQQFHDSNGHAAGDDVLRQVAALLAEQVRPGDVVYRYGGEEFCVLLRATAEEEALEIAERLRASVENAAFDGAEHLPDGRVTVSVGMALAGEDGPDEVTRRADAALDAAKDAGRNRVVSG